MQQINNDIDELFRKAADEYPLKTSSQDWSAVQKKLAAKEVAGEDKPVKKIRQPVLRYIAFALLLLIPLSTAVTGYVFNGYSAASKNIYNKTIESDKISLSSQHSTNTPIATSKFTSQDLKDKTITLNAYAPNSTLAASLMQSSRFDLATIAPI